jgi:ankyrin repeat protein
MRLTHFTLQEHLKKHWKDLFPFGHSTIAVTCLSYLQFDHKIPPPYEWDDLDYYVEWLKESPPLLQYAVENVGYHLKITGDPALAEQCIAILEQDNKFRLLTLTMLGSDYTSLHWAAYFGCTSVAELLLRNDRYPDLNAESQGHQRPPLYTIEQHNEQMTGTMLKRSSANINSKSVHNFTPLSLAAWNGHAEVVKLLLGAPGVDVNANDDDGRTPLLLAAWNGHAQVVKLLLSAPGVDVNASNAHDSTPLSLAVEEGHAEVVKLLLGAPGVDVNASDAHDSTPLSLAVQEGHAEVVKLLLGAPGVDVNVSDKDGNTPFLCAAYWGHESIVRLLLGTPGIDINHKNRNGQTAHSRAAAEGHKTVAQLLRQE